MNDQQENMTLDAYLRHHTREVHEETEEGMRHLNLFSGNVQEVNYLKLLNLQYAWHYTLENFLQRKQNYPVFNSYTYEPKAQLIEEDIISIQHTRPATEARQIEDDLSVPGVLYVLEGSMLGSTMIYRELKKSGIPEGSLGFYSYCQEQAPKKWPQAKAYLRQFEDHNGFFQRCLTASNYGFQLMKDLAAIKTARTG